MNRQTFRRVFGYTSAVPAKMPQLASGQDKRDLGRYSIPEAASFISMPQRTMRSWFLGDHRIFTPSFHKGDSVFLSFNDVTEAYIVESLRNHWGFHPKAVRRIIAELRRKTRMERPLLYRELSVIPEFQSVVATIPDKGTRVHVDVAHSQNLVFDEFVQTMAMRVTRDSKGRPVRIYPGCDAASADTPVSMDPDVMSGELVVTGTRIPAKMILAKQLSGKSAEEIADSYHLDRDLIRNVLQHFEREKP
jgi:uncharacterized protein (DUF433 family)